MKARIPIPALLIAGLTVAVFLGGLLENIAESGAPDLLGSIGLIGVVTFLLFPLMGLLLVRRQPSNPVGWLLLGIGLSVFLIFNSGHFAATAATHYHGPLPLSQVFVVLSGTIWLPFILMLLLFLPMLPFSFAIAVLRYRLYDIDVVITRALVYGVLAAFITAVYVGIVVGIGRLVGSGTRPSIALSIVATAVVAVAFQPVRERVQRFANRLVYGERATPYEVMAGFADQMAGTLSADDVLPQMAEAAARGVGAQAARVTLALPGVGDRSTIWPADAGDGRFSRLLPVSYRGEPVGEIAVRENPGQPITPGEGRLLADLPAQAGLVLHNVRLPADLQARLADLAATAAELRASRQRIGPAQATEPRRLGGEIRTGVQRELEATAEQLDEVERLLDDDGATAAARLEALTDETQHSLDRLRELARGIFPALLRDQGLIAALRSQLMREATPISLEGDRVGRYPPEVEAAIYFCCLQLLDSARSGAAIKIHERDGQLVFSVNGVALGPDTRVQDLEDRIAASGGSLLVDGDTISGKVPIRPAAVVA